MEVELAVADPDEVAGGLRQDQIPAERLAQLGDVHLERRPGGVGRRGTPELVDEPVAGDDLVGVQQQEGEQGALLRAAELQDPAFFTDLERPEDAELHALLASLLAGL